IVGSSKPPLTCTSKNQLRHFLLASLELKRVEKEAEADSASLDLYNGLGGVWLGIPAIIQLLERVAGHVSEEPSI
ncbi:MAG TPA: hypothetical protein VIL30_24735, partial [Ramlibacter sp.]